MITNMVNDILGGFSAIGNADPNTQVVLFLAVFVALPWTLSYLKSWARPHGNVVGGDMVGGDKITYHDEDDDEQEGYVYKFPRPSVTATVMLVHAESGTFFVGYRGEDVDAYPGAACLPGGFLEAKRDDHPGERVEETAIRETLEEASVSIDERDLHLLCVKSHPNTDPRAHVINVCYLVFVDDEQKEFAKSGDDLSGYDWRRINDIERESGYAFNHYEIIIAGGRLAATMIQARTIAKGIQEARDAQA